MTSASMSTVTADAPSRSMSKASKVPTSNRCPTATKMSSAIFWSVGRSLTCVAMPHSFTSPSLTILSAGGRVQGEATVALQVPRLGRPGHHPEPQLVVVEDELAVHQGRLDRADAGEAVPPQGADHEQPAGGDALLGQGGDLGGFVREGCPGGHADTVRPGS